MTAMDADVRKSVVVMRGSSSEKSQVPGPYGVGLDLWVTREM